MSDAIPLPPRPDLDQYRMLARELQRAGRTADPGAVAREAAVIERRWREFLRSSGRGRPDDRARRPTLTDAQFFIARAHGFASWSTFAAHLEALRHNASPTALFESAVDAIVAGDAATLQRLLRAHPELVRARSTRDHRSTLLHYVSANGVEDFRQITPANIVSMTGMLLAAGADVNAASEAYGGGSTTLGLVATSIHPARAGVQVALLETLLRHGARIDGDQAGNGHGIVLGCLANGQLGAAQFFAERGASLSLVEAAGVGLLDRVQTFFDDSGRARPPLTPADLDSALQYAAWYGHADIVEFLIQRGAAPGTPKVVETPPATGRGGGGRPIQLEITTAEINICAWTPDGRRAITAAQGRPVTIWDADSGRAVLALDPDSTNAWVASWTSNPTLVLAGSRDRSIGLWDIESRQRVCVLRGHHGPPRTAQANAGLTRVLSGCSSRDRTVKLWDLRTGGCLRTLEGHADGVYTIAWHGDNRAASGSRDTTIRIWDLDTGRTLRVLQGHIYHVHSVAWSGDGRRLLSGSTDLRLWDADSGRCVRVFEGHTDVIRSVVWSPGETRALSASHDGTARLWDVGSGRCVRVFEADGTGLVAASFSADGHRVFTCDWPGAIRVWSID